MNKTILQIVCIALILAFPCGKASGQYKKIPVVVITDLYHPYQDPGDNMDQRWQDFPPTFAPYQRHK